MDATLTPGTTVFAVMWPDRGHFNQLSLHAALDGAKARILARLPAALAAEMKWADSGQQCRLQHATAHLLFPLPYVTRWEVQ